MTSLIVHRMCSRESLSTRKISCAEMNVFQVHHLCFRNCGLRINTLIYLSPRLQLVCEQCFAEEIRQKAFKSHINLKLASALLCSLYFYVANSKNFPTSVSEVIQLKRVFWGIQMEVYLSGCKGQRELGMKCTIIFPPHWNVYRT